MNIRLLTSAIRDLEAAKEFYDGQQLGVGAYFLDSLVSDIDSLVLYAGIHRKVFGHHRMLAKRFPYAIYYRLGAGDEVIVFRVLDCRRDPAKLPDELK